MRLLVGEAQFFSHSCSQKKLFKTINDKQIIVFIAIQGRREGGQGGEMTPGPMDFRGPMSFRKAVGFSGPMSSRGGPSK